MPSKYNTEKIHIKKPQKHTPGLFLYSDFIKYVPAYALQVPVRFINSGHCEKVFILPRVLKCCLYFHWCKFKPVVVISF